MNLEWIAEDPVTLVHSTKMEVDGITCISPVHALTKRDLDAIDHRKINNGVNKVNLSVSGESLGYQTFQGIGSNGSTAEALLDRTKEKLIDKKINLVHFRIPREYVTDKGTIPVTKISELQASSLLGVQLEADASFVVPPLPSGLNSLELFKQIYERTKVEIQTFKKEKDVVGYIPTTDELPLIPEMIKMYVKDGIKFFAVDFSSSPLNRWLIRTVVSAIRNNMKIRGSAKDNTDKQYYLHVFNVAANKKTPLEVAPITDVLAHNYGVDSTSGVVWGGGKLVKEKLRLFNMDDYGAYQIGVLEKEKIQYDAKLLSGSPTGVYDNLRVHRLIGYKKECDKIVQTMSDNTASVESLLSSKSRAKNEVKNILMDIKEIRSRD